ncbi:thioredoxin, partial [bacterium]|nr:thioredoxin [bacterium]
MTYVSNNNIMYLYVRRRSKLKVLKFGAVWCPGCLIMKPRWEEIEKENIWLKTEYYD